MTKKHQTISSERFIRIKFISFYQVFCNQVSEINRSNATNRHFDRAINSLFCNQSVSLQFQQTSDVSSASTNNFASSTFDNRQNRQCIRRFQHRMQSSAFHREWRCSQLTATDFRNRQPSACIWSFYDRMQQSDNQTTSPVHLMHQYRMQSSGITDNFVSASDRLESGAVSLTSHFRRTVSIISSASTDNRWASILRKNQTISSVHSTISALNAILTIRQSRQCIWSFEIECSFSGIETIANVHLMTSTSDAAFRHSSRKTSDQRTFATDNCQRASDRFTVECSSLTIRQLRQCI